MGAAPLARFAVNRLCDSTQTMLIPLLLLFLTSATATEASDSSDRPAVVYCREIPTAWKLDAPMDERGVGYGLFLKVGDEEAGSPLLLVTSRIAIRSNSRSSSSDCNGNTR